MYKSPHLAVALAKQLTEGLAPMQHNCAHESYIVWIL